MDQGHRAVVSHIQRSSLAHCLVSGKEEEQWFKHRPKTPVTRGFFYCHGGLVKSHLDKPTSFSELQLPALRYTCACLQKVIWSRIPALNSQNYLWSVTAWTLDGGWPLTRLVEKCVRTSGGTASCPADVPVLSDPSCTCKNPILAVPYMKLFGTQSVFYFDCTMIGALIGDDWALSSAAIMQKFF